MQDNSQLEKTPITTGQDHANFCFPVFGKNANFIETLDSKKLGAGMM